MPVLLMILSVLALWAFLAVLVIGLLLVFKTLQGVRGYLEKIAMGVRAIEHQVLPLGRRTEALAGHLAETAEALQTAGRGLAAVDARLDAAAPALRPDT